MKRPFMERMSKNGSLDMIIKHCLRTVRQGSEGTWQMEVNNKPYCIMSGCYCPLQYNDNKVDSLYACMDEPFAKE